MLTPQDVRAVQFAKNLRGYRTEDDCIYLLKEKLEQLAQSLAGLSAHRTPMEDIEHDSE